MDLEKIMNFEWDKYIVAIIEGLKNFVAMINKYMPKSMYNFEDPGKYESNEENGEF